jgi:cytochrome c
MERGSVDGRRSLYKQEECRTYDLGTSYFSDSLKKFKWVAELNGKKDSSQIVSKGYVFKDNQVYLKYALIVSSGIRSK